MTLAKIAQFQSVSIRTVDRQIAELRQYGLDLHTYVNRDFVICFSNRITADLIFEMQRRFDFEIGCIACVLFGAKRCEEFHSLQRAYYRLSEYPWDPRDRIWIMKMTAEFGASAAIEIISADWDGCIKFWDRHATCSFEKFYKRAIRRFGPEPTLTYPQRQSSSA